MPKLYQSPLRYKATELRSYYAPYFVTRSLTPTIGTAVPTFTRSGTATYLDNTGVFQQAASGVPRFEYEYNATTGLYDSIGLLIEGNGQTNLRTWSNDFTNAIYTTVNTSVTAVTQGPLTTAFSIAAAAVNGTHRIQSSVSTVANNSLTYSVMAKANGVSNLTLWTDIGAVKATFDLSAGTVAASTGTTYTKIKNLGNGWYHCFMSYTAAATSSTLFYAYVGNDLTNYIGNGTDGILLSGMQIVINSTGATPYFMANSYIPTTSTTANRANEQLVFSDVSWQTTAGTYEALFRGGYENGQGLYGRVISAGTTARTPIASAANGFNGFDGTNSFTVTLSPNNATKENFAKAVTSYSNLTLKQKGWCNGIAWVNNGVTAYASSAYVGGCAIGHNLTGPTSNALNGHIKSWAFYPTDISDNDSLQRSRL